MRSIIPGITTLLIGGIGLTAYANEQNLDLRQDSNLGKPAARTGVFIDADADLATGSLSRQQFSLSTPLGIKRLGEHAYSIGVNYRLDRLDFSGIDSIDSDYYHHLQIPVTWRWTPKASPWGAMLSFRPGLATDFDSIGSDDFSLAAIGMVSYEVSETFTFGLGAYYSRDFGEDRIFPGIGLIWTPTPDWRLDLLGPRLTIAHQLSDEWILKLSAWTNGGSWNIDQDGANQDLNLRSFRAGVGVERRLSKHVWLEAWAGTTLAQNLEVAENGKTLFDENIDSSAFGYIGLKVTFW